MNSKMTEKEFRERMLQKWAVTGRTNDVASDAVEVAREAGLEFAPEPVALPEQLEISREFAMGYGWAVLQTVERGNSTLNHAAILAAAIDRYNAYPGLRAAAELLVQRVVGSTAAVPLDLLQALEAELAKGPK